MEVSSVKASELDTWRSFDYFLPRYLEQVLYNSLESFHTYSFDWIKDSQFYWNAIDSDILLQQSHTTGAQVILKSF